MAVLLIAWTVSHWTALDAILPIRRLDSHDAKPTFQNKPSLSTKIPVLMTNWESNDPFLVANLGMKLRRFCIDGRQWLDTTEHGPAVYSCCLKVLLP